MAPIGGMLLSTYGRTHRHTARDVFDADALADYVQRQAEDHRELESWHVAVRGLQKPSGTLGTEDLGIHGGPVINLMSRSQMRTAAGSVGVLTDPEDLSLGLTNEQRREAEARVRTKEFRTKQAALISVRSAAQGLLLIYPVSRNSAPEPGMTNRIPLFTDPEFGCTVIGVALVFPPSQSHATVEYMVGARWKDGDE